MGLFLALVQVGWLNKF